jgi:putative peptidoglycan lipid II flippase
VFFLAPYAILAQPIHTAILPELVVEARADDLTALRHSVTWGIERMALLVLPVATLMMALALPAMRIVSFGEAAETGPGLLAAGLAALAAGLFPYSAFLLLTRACFALGDSRTPALVSLSTAAVGVGVMAVGSTLTEGTARVAVLGAGHTVANLAGLVVLWRLVARRTGGSLWPSTLGRMAAVAVVSGIGVWLAAGAVLDGADGRTTTILIGGGLGGLGVAVVAAGYRALGIPGRLASRAPAPVAA